MRLHMASGSGQSGDGRFPNLHASNIDPLLVRSHGHGHALLRVINAIDLALSDCSQLTNGSASAATYVEDYVLFSYRSVR